MSRVIIDLAAKRGGSASMEPLLHPAGVKLPFDGPSDAALIIPEIRQEIRAGSYSADVIGLLSQTVDEGDRVLVIGAGLGVVSTLVAKIEGVDRVIAVEANTTLIPYLNRVHEANDVPEIETVNAVLAEGKKGRVPFFARRDLRMSSLLPHDRSWQQVMMVPFMDLNLILTEEEISVIICDIPVSAALLVAQADLDGVDRVLINCSEESARCWEDGGACALLIRRGFLPEPAGGAVLFRRAESVTRSAGAGPSAAQRAGDEALAGAALPSEAADTPAGPELDEIAMDELGIEDFELDDTIPEAAETEAEGHAAAKIAEAAEQAIGAGRPADETEWEMEARRAESRRPTLDERMDDDLDRLLAESASDDRPDIGADGGSDAGVEIDFATSPARPQPGTAGQAGGPPEGKPGAQPGAQPEAQARGQAGADKGLKVGAKTGTTAPTVNGASRIWSLVALALFLALPLILIGNYAADRAGSQAIVAEQIGAAWGGPQTLTGPYLVVPVASRGGALAEPLVLLPDLLDIDSELTTEVRSRGVFETPVYRGRHDIRLGFDPARLSGERANELLAEGETPLWDQAVLGLGIAEPRALKGALELNRPDGRASFESGSGIEGLPGIHARVGDARDASQGWLFTLELDGSRRFLLTPAGRVTRGRLHSDWPHGGFAGSFLPSVSQAGVTGFVAEWSVPQLAHSLPQAFRGTAPLAALGEAAFGVDLLPPTDLYDGARQAAKFGFAVIVLSFAMIYLMERSAARRPHLVQYGLIGTVQCLFFVLLLSLAEQIGLGPAYALAAAATIALLTLYSWFGLGLGQRSVWLCAALIVTYGGIYLVLTQGQTLLMAALLAFVAVAAAMWGTRNGDWSTALPRDWRAAWNGNGPQPGPQASSNS